MSGGLRGILLGKGKGKKKQRKGKQKSPYCVNSAPSMVNAGFATIPSEMKRRNRKRRTRRNNHRYEIWEKERRGGMANPTSLHATYLFRLAWILEIWEVTSLVLFLLTALELTTYQRRKKLGRAAGRGDVERKLPASFAEPGFSLSLVS